MEASGASGKLKKSGDFYLHTPRCLQNSGINKWKRELLGLISSRPRYPYPVSLKYSYNKIAFLYGHHLGNNILKILLKV